MKTKCPKCKDYGMIATPVESPNTQPAARLSFCDCQADALPPYQNQ